MYAPFLPYQQVTITAIKDEVPGVKTFTVASVNGTALPYKPGQFITLVFTHHGREGRRSYSITSGDVPAGALSFTVKRVDNGAYSRMLTDRAMPGDLLYTTGAGGLFTLPAGIPPYTQLFFFAAGIGITPVIALMREALLRQPQRSVVLVYSNARQQDAVFHDELLAMARQYSGLKLVFLYSNAYDLARARLSKALLPQLVREHATVPTGQALFFICGPYSYMRMATLALEEMGVHGEQIHKENFNTNDRDIVRTAPPDHTTRRATLHIGHTTRTFNVVYPDTILQAAKKNGVQLPYSCEVGRCGSCAGTCTSGRVWLSYNEVLMDSELKQGRMLTCVGHPLYTDVVITI